MADLIIKPTSGNLLIKDDQDATRLTVATSTGATTLTNQVFPAGHVIQVISSSYDTGVSTTSTSPVSINAALEPSITPSSSSNKIFITWSVPQYNNTAGEHVALQVYRGSTALGDSSWGFGSLYASAGSPLSTTSGNYLDSPSTTSAVQYKLWHFVNGGTGTSCMNGGKGTITLMEVVA